MAAWNRRRPSRPITSQVSDVSLLSCSLHLYSIAVTLKVTFLTGTGRNLRWLKASSVFVSVSAAIFLLCTLWAPVQEIGESRRRAIRSCMRLVLLVCASGRRTVAFEY